MEDGPVDANEGVPTAAVEENGGDIDEEASGDRQFRGEGGGGGGGCEFNALAYLNTPVACPLSARPA